jgi:DNA-binding CsgD family transcriptional regulator/type II secretory pathway predicted ATPase ExeA
VQRRGPAASVADHRRRRATPDAWNAGAIRAGDIDHGGLHLGSIDKGTRATPGPESVELRNYVTRGHEPAAARNVSGVLLGRAHECDRLDALLDAARIGQSGALLVRGEPGVGKTVLLRYAMEQAADLTVTATVGTKTQHALPFATLADLLSPFTAHLTSLPPAQAAALGRALGLDRARLIDRFTVGAATLSLLAAAAERCPVLVVVDDAHLVDPSSAEALLFAARRLEAEGVALLVAVREGEASRLDDPRLPTLSLGGLARRDALGLLGERVTPEVGEQLVDTTAGNPLALLEITALLNDDQRTGRAPLDEPLPTGPSLERAFLTRVEGLPAEVRRLLVVASADWEAEPGVVQRAAQAIGIDEGALAAAIESGALHVDDGRLEFSHTLLRSAVYHTADPALRRQAHQTLAGALRRDHDLDRRAWHLAAAAAGPDEQAASALERAATSARHRGAYAVAGEAMARAAELSPASESRVRQLITAADAFWLGGQFDRCLTVLDEALASTDDPIARADVQLRRWVHLIYTQAQLSVRELLISEAERIEPLDRMRAAQLMTFAALPELADRIETARETAERAMALAEPVGETFASVVLALSLALEGNTAEARSRLRRASDAETRDGLGRDRIVEYVGIALTWLGDYDEASATISRMVESARTMSAPATLAHTLTISAELSQRTGRWTAALADASEAVTLARETGQESFASWPLVALARVEAGLGLEQEAHGHVTEAIALATQYNIEWTACWGHAALGFLEVSFGRPERAVGELEWVAAFADRKGLRHPGALPWAPDLVEAYLRVGRPRDAERVLSLLGDQATATGDDWALAATLRCRGLLEADGEFEAHFCRALELHGQVPMPFERARTELCFGERLRRARRRRESVDHLLRAHAGFERLGAAPWVKRAAAELRVAGHDVEGPSPSSFESLTPQELQIALVVGRGATNREAAGELLLSRRTVEHHLARIYRKLGLHSRSQLVRRMAEKGEL